MLTPTETRLLAMVKAARMQSADAERRALRALSDYRRVLPRPDGPFSPDIGNGIFQAGGPAVSTN